MAQPNKYNAGKAAVGGRVADEEHQIDD